MSNTFWISETLTTSWYEDLLIFKNPKKKKKTYYTFFLKKEQEKKKKTLHCTKAQKLKIDGNVNE